MKKPNRRSKQKNVDSSPSSNSSLDLKKRVLELENENESLKREITEIRSKLAGVRNETCKETHLQRGQYSGLKKKIEAGSHFSTRKPKSDDAVQDEIQRLKAQKVQLQCKLKLESVQFRRCKASLQKEILQLKKEKRRTDFQMHLLLALNQKQKLVLQRKAKETSMAMERLKYLLESRKTLACKTAGSRTGSRTKYQRIDHELDVTAQVQEICAEYECQMEMMVEVIEKLRVEAETLREDNSRCALEDDEADLKVKDSEFREIKDEVVRLGNLVSRIRKTKMEETHQIKLFEDHTELNPSSVSIGSNDRDQPELNRSSVSTGSNSNTYDTALTTLEGSTSDTDAMRKLVSGVCCSCSKNSLCKTSKCGCRAAGGSCGPSCSCAAAKCTNREPIKLGNAQQSQMDKVVNCPGMVEESNSVSSSQHTVVHNPLVEKPNEIKNDRRSRKQPLQDIGNILVKSKPGLRKRGKKPILQDDSADSK